MLVITLVFSRLPHSLSSFIFSFSLSHTLSNFSHHPHIHPTMSKFLSFWRNIGNLMDKGILGWIKEATCWEWMVGIWWEREEKGGGGGGAKELRSEAKGEASSHEELGVGIFSGKWGKLWRERIPAPPHKTQDLVDTHQCSRVSGVILNARHVQVGYLKPLKSGPIRPVPTPR